MLFRALIICMAWAVVAGCGKKQAEVEIVVEQLEDMPAKTSKLDPMAHYLEEASGAFEDRKDVKCWSSFKQLENFVAGCPLDEQAPHARSAAVRYFLGKFWREASHVETGASISAASWQAIVAKHLSVDERMFISTTVRIGNNEAIIPWQDLANYHATVEPIRAWQTLLDELGRSNEFVLPLSSKAQDRAFETTTLLSVLLLKNANIVARKNNRLRVDQQAVQEAANQLAHQLQLPLPELKYSHVPTNSASAADKTIVIAERKMSSLSRFNNRYSEQVLKKAFEEDLSRHIAEWADVQQVEPGLGETLCRELLPRLLNHVITLASEEADPNVIISGADLLEGLQRGFPFVTATQAETLFWPEAKTPFRQIVQEYQGDAFRDSGGHWLAIKRAVLERQKAKEPVPEMDLYALEELSEFASSFGVALVKATGEQLRNDSASKQLTADAVRHMLNLFLAESSKQRKRSSAKPKRLSEMRRSPTKALAAMAASYVAEPFTDLTIESKVAFIHESSELVRDTRRPPPPPGSNQIGPNPVEIQLGISGGGVAAGDIDGDGLPDLFFCSGKGNKLFLNKGHFQFFDITTKSDALSKPNEESRGGYFVDYDNDGDQDLFITQVYAPNRLFQNDGTGVFTDVTKISGLPMGSKWISHSAVWFDCNNDGLLDVYICNFGNYVDGILPIVDQSSRNGEANRLYKQTKAGRFVDVTSAMGAGDVGWSHAVSHFDVNNDGFQDLYLANDFGHDVLLVNQGGIRFEAQRTDQGIVYHHGMSVSMSDIDRDGIEDVYVSNIATFVFNAKYIKPSAKTDMIFSRRTADNLRMIESNVLLTTGSRLLKDETHRYFNRSQYGAGWAWDADFFDFDNDGEEDLYVANGREPNFAYDSERNVLFKQQNGHFFDVSAGSTVDFPDNSRGCVHADLDGDGDLDLVVNNYHNFAKVFRNNLQRNNWLQIQLKGKQSNRDGIGARIILKNGDRTQLRTIRGGSGFLSKEPAIAHFGLGVDSLAKDLSVSITWPSGKTQEQKITAVNQRITLVEP